MSPLQKHSFIAWFASNPVVANILMLTILAAGIFSGLNVRKEGFPAFAAESVTVTVPIRGGTPENVERGVAIKIEEALESVDGIDHIRSVSTDDSATITIEAKEGYPVSKLLEDAKIQIDAIPSFPEQAENPVVVENERDSTVLWVELYGDASETVLKEAARKVRDALLRQPAISKVETFGARDYEISIEPSEDKLRLYNLTFSEVADAISNNSIDVGGGVLRSPRGDISLRSQEQAYVKKDFLKIPPTVSLQIITEGRDDIVDAVKQARALVSSYTDLPEGVMIDGWLDGSTNIKDRLNLLGWNGAIGVLLVLGILMVFLNLRLAFWVAIGIPVSLAGAMMLFPIPGIDLSLNVISAFGFLIVLGIVVDDAIVIGESIYTEKENVKYTGDSKADISTTVAGVSKVVTPATFGVITTIAAFLPLTQVSGRLGNVFGQIATVVVFCLLFSLIESKLIMPSHLAHLNVHKKPNNWFTKGWARFQKLVSDALQSFIDKFYRPIVRFLIPWRYAVFAMFISIFALVIALIARTLGERYEKKFSHNPFLNIQVSASTNTRSSVAAELTRSASRDFLTTEQIVKDWRKAIGAIAGSRSLSLSSRAGPPGGDLVINLESDDLDELRLAAQELKKKVAVYEGVFDVFDTFDSGRPEILYS